MDFVTLLIFASLAFFSAGAIKGVAGVGLPTVAIGFTTFLLDPRTAISLLLLPMLVMNAWQVYRSGQALAAFRRYLPFLATLISIVSLTLYVSRDAPDRLLIAMLGITMLAFVAVNARQFLPPIPDRLDTLAQIITGAISGVLGGLTSVWAPPMAMYLAGRGTQKNEFVRASGLLIFFGSLPMVVGYYLQGYLAGPVGWASLAMLIPAIIGFTVGERIRARLSESRFRKVLLVVFFFIGLNLLRRAIWGL